MRSAPERGPDGGLIRRLAEAQRHPPIGLILVGWDVAQTDDIQIELESDEQPHPLEAAVVRSIAVTAAGLADETDDVTATDGRIVAIVRHSMTGPAAAEGLALRLSAALQDGLARQLGPPLSSSVRWAIGVATGHQSDRPDELLAYAERALADSWVLGGHQPAVFDDSERERLRPQVGSADPNSTPD